MTIRTVRRLISAVNVLAALGALALAFNVAGNSSAYTSVYQPVQPGSVEAPKEAEIPAGVSDQDTSWWSKGMVKREAPPPQVAAPAEPETIVGKYKLYSIMLSSNHKYAAIFDGQREIIYEEGETFGGYKLTQIFPDKVVVTKGNKTFELKREAPPRLAAASPGSERETPPDVVPPVPTDADRRGDPRRPASERGIRLPFDRRIQPGARGEEGGPANPAALVPPNAENSRQVVVSKQDKDNVINNFHKILQDVNLQPDLSDDGSMAGVKINNIQPGSALQRIGHLRAGDIVKKVNGEPVTSIPQLMQIYQQLSAQDVESVTAEIERDGKSFTQTYNIR